MMVLIISLDLLIFGLADFLDDKWILTFYLRSSQSF